ncbi:MAG: PHP domain-containing protein [Chloroflexi bacterium]|nr:PHP domain-containing protein [Chloroflexota bacterium]
MTSSTLWRVELHCHSRYSPDSLTSARAIITACRQRGIDRIAITEHNNIAGALAVQRLAPDLVIVGEEIKTQEGEIIAWFMHEPVPKGLTPVETIRRLRAQGAVIGIPHPLDSLRRGSAMGLDATLAIIDQVDALEVLNARSVSMKDNDRARALAEQYGKLMTAGSDAHTSGEIGQAALLMPPFTDAESFRASLAHARIEGDISGHHVHFYSTYAKIYKRLFGQKLP